VIERDHLFLSATVSSLEIMIAARPSPMHRYFRTIRFNASTPTALLAVPQLG